jgi:hypothetical protein
MSAACYKSVKSNFAEETDDWFFFHTTIQIDRSFVQSFFLPSRSFYRCNFRRLLLFREMSAAATLHKTLSRPPPPPH